MAIFSPLRSRRLAARQSEVTQQLIAFRLRREWFALPIDTVVKVVPLDKIYGDPNDTGISLTNYNGKELLVVDVGHRIFSEPPGSDLPLLEIPEITENEYDLTEQRYLVVIHNASGDLVGLPIDSQPAVLRVSESAFTTLPEVFLREGNIKCISSMMIQLSDRPPLFLLDRDRLMVER